MDAAYPVEMSSRGSNASNESRAPEPSSLVLFASGLMGMVFRFIQRTYDRAKRLFDIIGSLTALVILSPLCLLVALAIKMTSRGPVFFSQTRVGKDGKLFEIIKFRTMKTDAEKETGPVWALANDSRLIPIGNFLRKAHIDEIPQFLNVLKGEMSIIGPRPERPEFIPKLRESIPLYETRLMVKPGITGLAQVRHRYDETIEDVKKKVRYDRFYINKLNFWTDLLIVMRTVRVVFTGEGAR